MNNIIPFAPREYKENDSSYINPLYAEFNDSLGKNRPYVTMTPEKIVEWITKAVTEMPREKGDKIVEDAFVLRHFLTDNDDVCNWLNVVRWTKLLSCADVYVADCLASSEDTKYPRSMVVYNCGRGIKIYSRNNTFDQEIDVNIAVRQRYAHLNSPGVRALSTKIPVGAVDDHGCLSHHVLNALIVEFILSGCSVSGGVEVQQRENDTSTEVVLSYMHLTSPNTIIEWYLIIDTSIYPVVIDGRTTK